MTKEVALTAAQSGCVMTAESSVPVSQAGAAEPFGELIKAPFHEWPLAARFKYCQFLAQSTNIPRDLQNQPANLYLVAERGAKLAGLSPTESISSIYVVNGVTSLWGDLPMALIRASGKLAAHDEWAEVDGVRVEIDRVNVTKEHSAGKDVRLCVMVERKGEPPYTRSYSVADAIQAGLWMNASRSPWIKSPRVMLLWRARGLAFHGKFQDVLQGMAVYGEAEDLGAETVSSSGAATIQAASAVEMKGAPLAQKIEDAASINAAADVENVVSLEMILESTGGISAVNAIRRSLKIDLGVKPVAMPREVLTAYTAALNIALDKVGNEKSS